MTRYLRNVWYMAAWSEEVPDEGLFTRRLFDQPILFFRKAEGEVAALTDRCPHRFAPLSMGSRDGDTVVCGYHGLAFAADGRCVRNPFAERIPAGASVRAYAVEERFGIVWLWGGHSSDADPALIPDFSMIEAGPTVRVLRGYTHMRAPYEFGTDNLLDLSHIEFVHKGSLAGEGVIFAGKHEVIEAGDILRSNWWMPGVPAPMHTRGVYPPEMITDHWLDMRWNAPASMHLEVGATPAGSQRSAGFMVQQAHILTPETATTAHYFYANPRSHDLESVETDAFLRNLFRTAFDDEDKPMIEAAYANLDGVEFWDAKPLFLGVDAGGTRARRKLEAMIAREMAEAA